MKNRKLLICFFFFCIVVLYVLHLKLKNYYKVQPNLVQGVSSDEGVVTFLTKRVDNPSIVVNKSDRKLFLYDGELLLKTYKIALGFSPLGHKEFEGDGKTPEGEYRVCVKNNDSKYYLSVGLDYPRKDDFKAALDKNVITLDEFNDYVSKSDFQKCPPMKTKLGGEIYIHGHGSIRDWTLGCIALKNTDMSEIFDVLSVGDKVVINP